MHQLDKLISAKCALLLKEKEDRVKFLQHSLAERDAEVNIINLDVNVECYYPCSNHVQIAQLKSAASNRERDYLARSADCEAQLVRLRSEVAKISHSYEQLKAKRYHRDDNLNYELKQELERVKFSLHLSNEELKTTRDKLALLETDNEQLLSGDKDNTKELGHSERYIVLQPVQTQETSRLLEDMFDKHCHHLNHEIQKIFSN